MRMKISEAAAASGCHLETIRYYERIGLMPPPDRTASGYRSYSPQEVERLRFISRGRDLGFTLEEIRDLLDLGARDGEASCEQVAAVARRHLAQVQDRIADLQRVADELARTLESCANAGRATCTILQALRQPGDVCMRRAAP